MKNILVLLILFLFNGAWADESSALKLPSQSLYGEKTDDSGVWEAVSEKDYEKLNIKRAYNDSEIFLKKSADAYFEIKYFDKNIKMLRYMNSQMEESSFFGDADIQDMKDFINNAWQVTCERDHITDIKICTLSKSEFLIGTRKKNEASIYCSRQVKKLDTTRFHYIRVNDNPPARTKTYFKGQAALNIIDQMKKGGVIYTRFYEWDEEKYEETLSLAGFNVAYEYMRKVF